MKELIKELGKQVKLGKTTWQEVADAVNEKYTTNLSKDAVRKRYATYSKEKVDDNVKEQETFYSDGSIEAQKIVNLTPEQKKNQGTILKVMGYDPNEWEVQSLTISNWQQHTKEQDTKQLYAVKLRVKPKQKQELDLMEYLSVVRKTLEDNIKPKKFAKKVKNKELDDNKLMELPSPELHLGKVAFESETGEHYNSDIAEQRFFKIIEEAVNEQDQHKCGKLFVTIGQDFFNTDTSTYTTTKGTPQQSDLPWKELFSKGLKMWIEAIDSLRGEFNSVDIQLCSGNHDTMASFYLFIALQQYFKEDDKVNFSGNWKSTQVYTFGKVAIFTHHGNVNLKRLQKSIPAEFHKEWGEAIYRELHLGHLHKEMLIDDESGLITRRVGSPSATDDWHYESRYIGATQKHQLFIWDKEHGLINIKMIPFTKEKRR